MFFLSVHQDETIFCYITAAFKKARLSVGKGRPWLFFPCFIRQVSPLPGDTVIGSGQPTRPYAGAVLALIVKRRFRGASAAH